MTLGRAEVTTTGFRALCCWTSWATARKRSCDPMEAASNFMTIIGGAILSGRRRESPAEGPAPVPAGHRAAERRSTTMRQMVQARWPIWPPDACLLAAAHGRPVPPRSSAPARGRDRATRRLGRPGGRRAVISGRARRAVDTDAAGCLRAHPSRARALDDPHRHRRPAIEEHVCRVPATRRQLPPPSTSRSPEGPLRRGASTVRRPRPAPAEPRTPCPSLRCPASSP